MKKLNLFIFSVVICLLTACHGNIWDAIEDLDSRVARLEELCKEMNTNISSLQTIVSVIQENDVITGVVPIEKEGKVVGYTITFDKHDPITIYNGVDGKDGANGQNGTNGTDGKDGKTPIIGVAKDADGVYYWTLNGEWLLDVDGNKIRVTGEDGKDGQDGVDGANGTNGKDGVIPQLKIEEGYWYVSYDNGVTWIEVGKAVGEDGKDGANGTNGKDGQDGDSMFTSVTYDEKNVTLTLADGTKLVIPLGEGVWDALEGLEERIAKLEELCKEMNTNISALQTIVSALQSNDCITTVTPIEKDGKVIGYTITFAKHEPITIYNGENGKDGANGINGVDGKDGQTPIIGVAKHTDGIYYWTLNGEWLLDADGNKICVTGEDGKDGQNGVDGTNGKDGVVPQLKIEEGYWYVSYDNGATWTKLDKAVGEDGKDGVDGEDGKNGDSMFTNVIYDENNVYFTLADGTQLILPRGNRSEFDQTIIDALVNSLTLDKQELVFAYDGRGTSQTIVATTLPFAESKVMWMSADTNIVKVANGVVLAVDFGSTIVTAYAGDKMAECNVTVVAPPTAIDLGLSVKWANYNVGAIAIEDYGNYFAWGEIAPKEFYTKESYIAPNEFKLSAKNDAAAVNWGDGWRMPTITEYQELVNGCDMVIETFANGVVVYKFTSKANGNYIYMPLAGYLKPNGKRTGKNTQLWYWASDGDGEDAGYYLKATNSTTPIASSSVWAGYWGYSVRAVKE